MDATLDFERILRILAEADIRIVVIGGVAMALRAVDDLTLDLDICYERSPDNVERLCRALAPICPAILQCSTSRPP